MFHAAWFLIRRRQLAGWLFEYYSTREESSWGPPWFRRVYRPTYAQTMAVVTAFSLAVLAAGTYVLVRLAMD